MAEFQEAYRRPNERWQNQKRNTRPECRSEDCVAESDDSGKQPSGKMRNAGFAEKGEKQ